MPRPRRPRSPPTSASLAVASLLFLLLPLDAGATCDASALYDPTYATSAAGRGAADVRAWLHERSSAFHAPRTYSQAWTDLESIDQHNASHVDVIYGGVEPKCRAGAYYGLACSWNREHLWPQSYGVGESSGLPSDAPSRADMHALVPSRAALNSARGAAAFAQITVDDGAGAGAGACLPEFAGCETPACTATTCAEADTASHADSGGVWQPPANRRGFIARAIFYMAVRYDGDANEPGTYDLRLGELDALDRDARGTGTYMFGALSHLLEWHAKYPVEAWEVARNDAVCAKQGNRNPFVDKPDLVAVVFGDARSAAAAAGGSGSDDARSDGGAKGGGGEHALTVALGLAVLWVMYIAGMFRWYV